MLAEVAGGLRDEADASRKERGEEVQAFGGLTGDGRGAEAVGLGDRVARERGPEARGVFGR
jgi:hypothetical protein